MADSPHEYDRGQACLNGHGITGNLNRFPSDTCKFCPKCGEPTIANCPNTACGQKIRGHPKGVIGIWHPPNFCHQCGAAFPWTARRTEALTEAIDELDNLSQPDRDKLKQSIPDVVKETPKSEIAAGRFQKAIKNADPVDAKMLSELLTKVATEGFLKHLA